MEPTQQFSILVSTLKTLNPKPLLKNPNFIVHPIVLWVDLILVSTLKTLNPKPLLKNPNFIVNPIVLWVDLQKVIGV
jgi:hypothetical protein